MRDVVAEANAGAGLGKKLDTIGPNFLFTYILAGGMILLGVSATVANGFHLMSVIFSGCGIGAGAFFITQASKYKVDIYEEGVVAVGGILTPSGTFRYSDIAEVDRQKVTRTILGIIPIISFFTVTLYGKDKGLSTSFSSFNFADLENKSELLVERVEG
jgi:hypothetical protein